MAATTKSQYVPYERTLEQFTLLSRETLTTYSGPLAVAPSTVANLSSFFNFGPFGTIFVGGGFIAIPSGDAIRVIKASYCKCFSGELNTVLDLRCQSLSLVLANAGVLLRLWPGSYSGNVLGQFGQASVVTDDELILGSDYAEQGGGPFQFQCQADIQNVNAVNPYSVIIAGVILFERWRLSTSSRMRG